MIVYLLTSAPGDLWDVTEVFGSPAAATAYARDWDVAHVTDVAYQVFQWFGNGPGVLEGRDSYGHALWEIRQLEVRT